MVPRAGTHRPMRISSAFESSVFAGKTDVDAKDENTNKSKQDQ